MELFIFVETDNMLMKTSFPGSIVESILIWRERNIEDVKKTSRRSLKKKEKRKNLEMEKAGNLKAQQHYSTGVVAKI